MELEDQVTSLELSKRLKELGVKQESYSCWVKEYGYDNDEYYLVIEPHKWRTEPYFDVISAFTVAELGEMLPVTIGENGKPNNIIGNDLWIYMGRDAIANWWCGYEKNGKESKQLRGVDLNEANSRAKMLVYLLENNLI